MKVKAALPALALLVFLAALEGCQKAKEPAVKEMDGSAFEPPNITV